MKSRMSCHFLMKATVIIARVALKTLGPHIYLVLMVGICVVGAGLSNLFDTELHFKHFLWDNCSSFQVWGLQNDTIRPWRTLRPCFCKKAVTYWVLVLHQRSAWNASTLLISAVITKRPIHRKNMWSVHIILGLWWFWCWPCVIKELVYPMVQLSASPLLCVI